MLRIATGAHGSGTAGDAAVCVAVAAAWTGTCWLLLRKRTLHAVERNLTDGTEAV
jgi:hypothetical protein